MYNVEYFWLQRVSTETSRVIFLESSKTDYYNVRKVFRITLVTREDSCPYGYYIDRIFVVRRRSTPLDKLI